MYTISFCDNENDVQGELWAKDTNSLAHLLNMLSNVPAMYESHEYHYPQHGVCGQYQWGTMGAEVIYIGGAYIAHCDYIA